MGILSSLFGSNRKQENEALAKARENFDRREAGIPRSVEVKPDKEARYRLTPWKTAKELTPVDFSGDRDRKLYVYNANPFAGHSVGDSFELEIFPGSASITSPYTGTSAQTDSHDCCFMYAGEPVGFATFSRDIVKTAFKRCKKIKVKALFAGWYTENEIPEIVFYIKDSGTLKRWQYIQSATARDVPINADVINLYVDDESVLEATEAPKKIKGATVVLEEAGPGSKAKPHFVVRTKDGELITRVTARSTKYATFENIGNRQPNEVVARLGEDGVTIVYLAYWDDGE